MIRSLLLLLAIAAMIGSAWIVAQPSKEECVASGRTVDPTGRHCDSLDGYVQLQEHAAFHGSQIAIGVVLLLVAGWGAQRLARRIRYREGT